MESPEKVLNSIIKQRSALLKLRKDILLSRTDIEVLAYAKLRQNMFSSYDLRWFYSKTNIQQLAKSLKRLEIEGVLEIVSKGVKNKPSTYWLTQKGEKIIESYMRMIS